MNYVRWILWKAFYAISGTSTNLDDFIKELERTRPPWWKFRPGMFHNDEGRCWEIAFGDESYFSQHGIVKCELLIGRESGQVVGPYDQR